MFGYTKTEARTASVVRSSWAQYPSALHVVMMRPRERTPRGFRDTGHPLMSTLILDGWGHPDVADWCSRDAEGNGRSRYLSCDPRWRTDFDAQIAEYLAKNAGKVTILLDARAWSAADPLPTPAAILGKTG